MTIDAAARKLAGNPDRPLFRVFAYYVFLFAASLDHDFKSFEKQGLDLVLLNA